MGNLGDEPRASTSAPNSLSPTVGGWLGAYVHRRAMDGVVSVGRPIGVALVDNLHV